MIEDINDGMISALDATFQEQDHLDIPNSVGHCNWTALLILLLMTKNATKIFDQKQFFILLLVKASIYPIPWQAFVYHEMQLMWIIEIGILGVFM